MRHPLTDTYGSGRAALIELGRNLTDAQAAMMTTACPKWSVKDVYAHLAGISTNIVDGNVEGAATEAWADGHVADRAGLDLASILDEWEPAGGQVSDVMASVADAFPPELFIDQWTHEWDIRHALGDVVAATPDDAVFDHYLDELMERIAVKAADADIGAVTYDVDGRTYEIGVGRPGGTVTTSTFEFARACMGRRAKSQLSAWPWPDGCNVDGHLDALVFWTISPVDIVDPVLAATT